MNSSTEICVAAALALASAACEASGPELPPLVFESERAIVGIDAELGDTLCAGDLARIDAQLEQVEARLDVRRDDPVAIHLVPFSVIETICGSDRRACYRNTEDTIYSTWQSLDHELVHAATRDLEFPSLFWTEGAAEVLSGSTLRDPSVMLSPSDLDVESLTTYRSAGHLSRFLVETYGWEAYGRVLRGDAFDDVIGRSVTELLAEYERDAPYAYPPLEPCPYPRIPQIDETTWRAQVEFSCESAEASEFEGVMYSASSGAAVVRAVELTAGTYDLELSGGEQMFALACHTEPLLDAPRAPSNGDLYNEIDLALPAPFEANSSHRLELTDGTYLISLSSGTYERASAEVTITRVE